MTLTTRMTGLILTSAPSLAIVDDALRRGGYDTLKVVTGWGIPGGWTAEAIQHAVRLAPNLIVRTCSGDPSLDGKLGGDHGYVDPNRVAREIARWYQARRDIWIELGNEPNLHGATTQQIYEFAYYLAESIQRCRREFPQAKLIAPAMKIDMDNAATFMRICRDAMAKADAIGLHAYEWTTFAGPASERKGEIEQACALAGELFPDKAWFLTEYGVNDPKLSAAAKGAAYAALLHQRKLPDQLVGATYYHLALAPQVIQPEYHIYPTGDLSYHHTRWPA